jgi:hypothetical protein
VTMSAANAAAAIRISNFNYSTPTLVPTNDT